MQNTQAEQQNSSPTAPAWSDGRGYRPALRYSSPTTAGRETTPVTVGRSVILNDECPAADAESRSKQWQSFWHVTSSTHRRRCRCLGCAQWKLAHDLISAHSDWWHRYKMKAKFSWSQVWHIHLATSSIQVEMMFWSSSIADGRLSPYTWVSSAYRWVQRPWPRRPCSDSSHVTAPYKLSFYYY